MAVRDAPEISSLRAGSAYYLENEELLASCAPRDEVAERWLNEVTLFERDCSTAGAQLIVRKLTGLLERRDGEDFCDFVIECADGRAVRAHRLVLMAWSTALQATCMNAEAVVANGSPCALWRLRLPQFDESTVRCVVSFLYTGRALSGELAQRTVGNIVPVLALARRFGILELERSCQRLLLSGLAADTSCELLRRVGADASLDDLRELVLNFIADNFLAVSRTDSFSAMSGADLAEVLGRDTLDVDREEDVWCAVAHWFEARKAAETTMPERFADSAEASARFRPTAAAAAAAAAIARAEATVAATATTIEKSNNQHALPSSPPPPPEEGNHGGRAMAEVAETQGLLAEAELVTSEVRFGRLPPVFLYEVVEGSELAKACPGVRAALFRIYRTVAVDGQRAAVGSSPPRTPRVRKRRASAGGTQRTLGHSFSTGTVNGQGSFMLVDRKRRDDAARREPGVTLERILQHSVALSAFLQQLREAGTDAPLLFWLDVEAYQNLQWKPMRVLGIGLEASAGPAHAMSAYSTGREADSHRHVGTSHRRESHPRTYHATNAAAALLPRRRMSFGVSGARQQQQHCASASVPQSRATDGSAFLRDPRSYAEYIYSRYLSANAPMPVRVPPDVAQPIAETVASWGTSEDLSASSNDDAGGGEVVVSLTTPRCGPTDNLFRNAQRHVFWHILNRELFPLFLSSPEFSRVSHLCRESRVSAPAQATANALQLQRRWRPREAYATASR